MSWVTDIILICSLEELYPASGEEREQPPAILGINGWLEDREWSPLVGLHDHIGMNSEKAFQAAAYGAALNFLDVPAFLRAVADQPWEDPDAILLLLKNEEGPKFAVYRMGEGGLIASMA